MHRATVILGVALLAATVAAAGPTSETIVFVGGESQSVVKAELKDGLVWVDHGNGRLQAFEPADIDLGASGLLPAPAVEEAQQPSPRQRIANAKVFSTEERNQGTEDGALIITDADVEHVQPEAEAEEEDLGDKMLVVGPLRRKSVQDMLNITGMVRNRSNAPAGMVSVTVAAMSRNGVNIASGSVTLRQPIPPGGSAPFSIIIEGAPASAELEAWADGTFPEGAVLAEEAPAPAGGGKLRGLPVGREGGEH